MGRSVFKSKWYGKYLTRKFWTLRKSLFWHMFSIIWRWIGSYGDQVWHCDHLAWWPPPRLYIRDTSQLLSSVLGSASKCPLAQSRPLTKRGKYVLWSPPAQAPVSKSGYEFQTLHLFRTLHPRGASCPSTIFWISFFAGDRKAALTNLPLLTHVAFEGWFTLNTCLVEQPHFLSRRHIVVF